MLDIERVDQDVLVKHIPKIFIQLINFKQTFWLNGAAFC
jgi:hypothetical protein